MFAHFLDHAPSDAHTLSPRRNLSARLPLLLIPLWFILSLSTATSLQAAPTVLRVKPTGTDTATCATWATACSLQHALAIAAPTNEIWVMKGTYKPTKTTDRRISFAIPSGVSVYGGFAGTETLLTARNWKLNITTLSGDIGVAGDAADNSYHVVIASGVDSKAILDGFTIKAGNANGNGGCPGTDCGGGMLNVQASPTLANLILTGNSAQRGGSGIYNYNKSSPSLTNVTFTGNSNGGMVDCVDSSPKLDYVTFRANAGGGMFNQYNSSPVLNWVTFEGNKGGGQVSCVEILLAPQGSLTYIAMGGTGMWNGDNSNATLTNVTFNLNTLGGMINWNSNPMLTNVTLSNNLGSTWGGGMMNFGSSPTLLNVTFSGNRAAEHGGAMINSNGSAPALTNVTISGNSAGIDGGAIYNISSSPVISNSILWGNTAPTGPEVYNTDGTSTPAISDSIVQGGYPTATNILDKNPKLVSLAANGGFTKTMALGAGSAAINAANASICPATDQRGKARRTPSGYCDLGAFESQPAVLTAHSGTPQTTRIGSEFPRLLAALVRDAYLNGLAGVPVTFSRPPGVNAPTPRASALLPDQPASGWFITYTDARGLASTELRANETPGTHYITTLVAGLPPVKFILTNGLVMENEHRGIVYDDWYGGAEPYASGGTYRPGSGSSPVKFQFTGTTVKWITTRGNWVGTTNVSLDGGAPILVDNFARTNEYNVIQSFTFPSAGTHTLELTPVSLWTVVDAFVVGTTTTQDDSVRVQYGGCKGMTSTLASGGSYRSCAGPDRVEIYWFGESFTWVTARGPNMGMARVYVDGVAQTPDIDLYSPTAQWKVPITFSGYAGDWPTIRIEVLGTKNPASSATNVVIDAFK